MSNRSCVAAAFIFYLTVIAHAQAPPDARLAQQCRSILKESIVDFYLPGCVDQEHGGYLENLDSNGRFVTDEKFLTLQARHLWFFSAIAKAGIDTDRALKAATLGYQFIEDHFHDPRNGGYFTKVARDGTPTDRRKHVYPLAFVIYGLVEYAEATGRDEPLHRAMNLFETLEAKCYDKEHGGYYEFFHDDWKAVTDPNASGYVGAIGTKTYNSHLHLMEAFTSLYQATLDQRVGKRLDELILINTVSVKHPSAACNIDAWKPDWTMIRSPKNLRVSYGHDIECIWLTFEAMKARNHPIETLKSWATTLAENSIKYGFDEQNGGFYYTGPINQPSDDRKKEWWTQSEALVGMLTMHVLTRDSIYQTVFEKTMRFVKDHQIAETGGWWATINADGSLFANRSRTSTWHGAYHNGRAMLVCARLLDDIKEN